MKENLLFTSFFLFSLSICAQNNIVKTTGIAYTAGPPTFIPYSGGSMVAIDTVTMDWYFSTGKFSDDWVKMGDRIQPISGCVPPAYVPEKYHSEIVINACDSLYVYRSGAWWHLNAGGSGGGTVSEGYGIDVVSSPGDSEVSVDTNFIATQYDAENIYRKWPSSNISSYQPNSTKRNWIIYNSNIQPSSVRNAFVNFDTINSLGGFSSTTNHTGNGIWMGTSSTAFNVLSGFSNEQSHGGGFNLMANGLGTFSDWKGQDTRGSILKALNWTTGSGDAAISFFRSKSNTITSGLVKLVGGDEIGAIRFAAADTTRALINSNTGGFRYPNPACAIVGYTYKTQFNNAHYGGIGIWTTNGSLTQLRAVAIDSTFSTTVRAGINVVPSSSNTLQVAGRTSIAGNLELSTVGNKILIATGTNASIGQSTLSAGTVTVSTTAVTANSIILAVHVTPSGTQGILSVPSASIVPGVSFVINSTSATDASTVNWWIVN